MKDVNTLRFTILAHAHPAGLHWDLLLEQPGTQRLATWRVDAEPEDLCAIQRAKRIFDHRRLYLDYEGEVSGGRGAVTRWDAGTYTLLGREPNFWIIELSGVRVSGQVRLDTSENSE